MFALNQHQHDMAQHNELGKWGEQVAYEYLLVQGYTIVERDTRQGHFEIDLIATKGNRIIFIEVKTRSDLKVDPVQSINSRKIGRICAAANSYVKQHKLPHEVQFDIVIVIGNSDNYTIEHIPDAFIAPMRGYR